MLGRETPRSWREPSILRSKPLFTLSMELKEAFKGLILSQNTSGVISFLSCLAGKTQGKNVGTPTVAIGSLELPQLSLLDQVRDLLLI